MTETSNRPLRKGISHLQVLLTPNTSAAIEHFAPVIALLDMDRC
jgi:hypothetical protein